MPVRNAEARWDGKLQDGQGTVKFGIGDAAYEGPYSVPSRFEEGSGTNPEELIGAAHAGCFSMALSGALGRAGHEPQSIRTQAHVHLEKVEGDWTITKIHLESNAEVPGLAEAEFLEIAQGAKEECPVSRALQAVPIELTATLAGS